MSTNARPAAEAPMDQPALTIASNIQRATAANWKAGNVKPKVRKAAQKTLIAS